MRKVDYILYLFIVLALYQYATPLESLGLLYFILIHELGHALVATHKGIFLRFGIKNGNPGVYISELDTATLLSGMILNLLTMNLILPLLKNVAEIPYYYIVLCIGVSLGDLYSIFHKSAIEEIEE